MYIRQRKEHIIMLWSASDETTSKTVFPVSEIVYHPCREKKLQAERKSLKKQLSTFNICGVKIHLINKTSMISRDKIIS